MNKILIILLTLTTIIWANLINISIENKNEEFQDFVFKESMNDNNTSKDNYDSLSKTKNNININLNSNYKDMIGFNYNKTINGITYDEKELYIGTPSMKYFSYSKIQKDINYDSRDTKKDISKMTIFHIFDIYKEDFSSTTTETIDIKKVDALNSATPPANISQSTSVHRNYSKEIFIASSENLYDVAKFDATKGEEYFEYGLFVKNITPRFKIYGVPIIGLVQYNFTDIENYVLDGNGTRRNIAYATKTDSGVTSLDDTSLSTLSSEFNLQGKYQGYEYGFKVTTTYKIKDYNLFLTLYNKKTILNNKYKYNVEQTNLNSVNKNVLEYRRLEITKQYISFGVSYSF